MLKKTGDFTCKGKHLVIDVPRQPVFGNFNYSSMQYGLNNFVLCSTQSPQHYLCCQLCFQIQVLPNVYVQMCSQKVLATLIQTHMQYRFAFKGSPYGLERNMMTCFPSHPWTISCRSEVHPRKSQTPQQQLHISSQQIPKVLAMETPQSSSIIGKQQIFHRIYLHQWLL